MKSAQQIGKGGPHTEVHTEGTFQFPTNDGGCPFRAQSATYNCSGGLQGDFFHPLRTIFLPKQRYRRVMGEVRGNVYLMGRKKELSQVSLF